TPLLLIRGTGARGCGSTNQSRRCIEITYGLRPPGLHVENIEAVVDRIERVNCVVHVDDGKQGQVGWGNRSRGSRFGIDLVELGRYDGGLQPGAQIELANIEIRI